MPGAEGQESKDEAFGGLGRGGVGAGGGGEGGVSPLFQARRGAEWWERGQRRDSLHQRLTSR